MNFKNKTNLYGGTIEKTPSREKEKPPEASWYVLAKSNIFGLDLHFLIHLNFFPLFFPMAAAAVKMR